MLLQHLFCYNELVVSLNLLPFPFISVKKVFGAAVGKSCIAWQYLHRPWCPVMIQWCAPVGDFWQYQGLPLLGLGANRPSVPLYLVPPCLPRLGSKTTFVSDFTSPIWVSSHVLYFDASPYCTPTVICRQAYSQTYRFVSAILFNF